MALTIAQIAELRGTDNVAGILGGDVVYTVTLRERASINRLRELTQLKQVPAWLTIEDRLVTLTIATPNPEWFANLEQEIINARRPA